MADLRQLFESLGHTEVVTLIQSGNVVFGGRPSAGRIDAAVAARFGIETFVVLRRGDELARVLEANPFDGADPSKLHVGFLSAAPSARAVAALEPDPFLPEAFAVCGREVYLHLPHGMARTRLPAYLDRRLGARATIRNWNTVTKLAEVAAD